MKREILQGRRGEDIALEYLLQRGYVLRERNWRSSHKEIDLIMESENYLHFVEVKSLTTASGFFPGDNVTKQKQRNLICAARNYIVKKRIEKEAQFDIISITFTKDGYDLEYMPAAFFSFY